MSTIPALLSMVSVPQATAQANDEPVFAPLTIDGELRTSSTVAGELRDVPMAKGPTQETTRFTLDAKGEILWDLERHVLHFARVEAQIEMQYTTATTETGASGEPAYSQDMTFGGQLAFEIKTSIED